MRNGFEIDRPFLYGVPYLSRKEEAQARSKMANEDAMRLKIPDMEIKEDDRKFIEYIRRSIASWQAKPKAEQEKYINIPGPDVDGTSLPASLNRYQLRLTHQIVRNEYPKLQSKGMGHFMQITNPNPEQQASELAAIKEIREREIGDAIGFRWIVEALVASDISKIPESYLNLALSKTGEVRDHHRRNVLKSVQAKLRNRKRILVGHNCFTDLVNLYNCFLDDLPDSVVDFQSVVHESFPGILDTKVMASFGNKRWGNTSLEDVEADLREESIPEIKIPNHFDRYFRSESYHEAGYDSLLTANIAIKLSAKMIKEGSWRDQQDQATSWFDSNTAEFGDEEEYVMALEHQDKNEASTVGKGNLDQQASMEKSLKPKVMDRSLKAVPAIGKHESGEQNKAKLQNKSNFYAILEQLQEGAENTDEPDQDALKEADKKRVDPMVNAGQIMPRWDNDFWKRFGNRLQVNGSKEGVCPLT